MVKKMDVERFNLKQLYECEVKEQYQVTIKRKFAALETEVIMGTSIGHGTISENIKISAKESVGLRESKYHKTCYDKKCLRLEEAR
jgi:hypothetical protein